MEKKIYERPMISNIKAGVPDKFGMQTRTKIIDKIEENKVSDLINNYGSPLYVLSENTIRKTYKEAYLAFSTRYPKFQFAWSYKTNYLNAVCKIFHSEGSWAEVVSEFEYDKARANGIAGENIIFNGPDKNEAALLKAIKEKALIHIDHFDELYLIAKLTANVQLTAKVAIRINMDTGIYPQWDRFGFNYENGDAWTAINRIMMNKNMHLVGLHTHLGTYIMTPKPYEIAASKMCSLINEVSKKFNHIISYIDLGGGFASKNTLKGAYLPGSDTCPSFDDYAEAITRTILNSNIPFENLPTLILETGRALIDDSAYILGSVIANKRLADGRRAMVIDIGVNFLFTSFWYNHNIYPAQECNQHTEDTTIYGPLCMNIDVIRDAVQFPALSVGEHVVIERTGAYNMTQWLQFIKMRPNIVLIDTNNKPHIIRTKENLDTITENEIVPEHLS